MPKEAGRTTARKRITLADGFVDVPVITEITFVDAIDRYQETQYSIDNSSESSRVVHVDQLHPTDQNGNSLLSPTLDVERIEVWPVFDTIDRGQETRVALDNITGADDNPPHFSTHIKTHVFRYVNPTNNNIWIDSEVIDSFSVIDPIDRYQEKIYTLNNPDEQADPDDPDISDTENGIDAPWRTDPFQNIVNFSSGPGITLSWFFTMHTVTQGDIPAGGCSPIQFIIASNPLNTYANNYLHSYDWPAPIIYPQVGVTHSGAPTVTGDQTLSDWQYMVPSLGGDTGPGGTYPSYQQATAQTATFNVYASAIVGSGPGCYADHSGGIGVSAGGALNGTTTIGTVDIGATGITASLNGNPQTYLRTEITGFARGIVVSVMFTP